MCSEGQVGDMCWLAVSPLLGPVIDPGEGTLRGLLSRLGCATRRILATPRDGTGSRARPVEEG